MKRLCVVSSGCVLLAAFVCDGISAQNVVRLVGRDYVFEAPDTIPAGLTIFEFRNAGRETHEALLKRIPAGHTMREVFADSAGIPKWVETAGGPNVIDPGVTARVMLDVKPGTYFWLCVIAAPDGMPHSKKGMLRRMVVTPPRASPVPRPVEPVAAGTIRLADFSFALSHPVRRGAQWLRVDNVGMKPHEVVIFRLAPGKTLEDATAWRRKDGPEPFTRIGGVAGIPPGDHAFVRFTGEPGRYILRCRIADADSGRTHRQLGMEMEFIVE